MAHQPYTQWMQAALDTTLPPDKQRQLHAHLAACPECHAHWEGLLKAARLLKQKNWAAPTADFAGRWQAKLQTHRTRPQLRWRAVALGAGAVGSAALVIPLGLGLLNALARVSQQPSTWATFTTNFTVANQHLGAVLHALLIVLQANGAEWVWGLVALIGVGLLALLAVGSYLLWRQRWARCQL